jgi:hypothetical protein
MLAILMFGPVGLAGSNDAALKPSLAVLPGIEQGQVLLRLTLSNASPEAVDLTLSRAGRQSCTTAPHVRVLRAGTREVVYPRGDEAAVVLCLAGTPTYRAPAGGQVTFDRTLDLSAGRYVVEAYVPSTPQTNRVIRAGYVVVTMR